MKSIQLTAVGRPLQLIETPQPETGPEDVLVQVRAAGICHSDAHYRGGVSPTLLPVTLGHEISGVAARVGDNVQHIREGDRVCVHYLATCGHCRHCTDDREQFCQTGQMMGKHRHGGYAEYVVVPGRSVFALPPEIPFDAAAVMMCSSATSLHALKKARLRPGESVAVFGFGGLGFSAVQLARELGAAAVFAVDLNPAKLKIAEELGAVPVDARDGRACGTLMDLTNGRGIDVALELVGRPDTLLTACRCLSILGRVALVGLTQKPSEIFTYRDIINKEAEIIGVSDHLASEIPLLLKFAREDKLRFPRDTIRTIPLEAGAVNQTLDALDQGAAQIRTVIDPLMPAS